MRKRLFCMARKHVLQENREGNSQKQLTKHRFYGRYLTFENISFSKLEKCFVLIFYLIKVLFSHVPLGRNSQVLLSRILYLDKVMACYRLITDVYKLRFNTFCEGIDKFIIHRLSICLFFYTFAFKTKRGLVASGYGANCFCRALLLVRSTLIIA